MLLRQFARETFSEHCQKSLWRTLFGYERLAVGAVMQLFELMQKQVFVKNLLYQTIDFVVQEIEANAFYQMHQHHVLEHVHNSASSNSRINQWLKHCLFNRSPFDWQKSVFDSEKVNASVLAAALETNEFREEYIEYVQEEVKSTQNKFRSLFEYLQGSFATSLAKNLVDLISFQKYQLARTNPTTAVTLNNDFSTDGHGSSSSNMTAPGSLENSPMFTQRQSHNVSSWSAAIGTKILNVSTNLYGINDIVGEFLVTSMQEMLGPSSLLHVGSVEEVVLKLLDSTLDLVRDETEDCKRVREAFEKIVASSSGPFFILQFEAHIEAYRSNRVSPSVILEHIFDSIQDLEHRSILSPLIAQAVAVRGNLNDNPLAEKLLSRLIYSMERFLLKRKFFSKLSWKFL